MELLQEFKKDIDGVMELVEKGEEIRARIHFNYDVEPKYKEEIKNPKSVLNTLLSFFLELNEYFNNERRYLLKENLSRQDMIDRYRNEYFEELKNLENK